MSSLPCPLHGRTRSRSESCAERSGSSRCGAPWAAFAGLVMVLASGQAQAFDPTPADDARTPPLHLEWTQSPGSATAANAAAPYGPATLQGNSTQTMLWAARGRVALGLGVEQRWTAPPGYPASPALTGERDGQWLLGVSLQTSLQTRLVWQMPTSYTAAAGEPVGGQQRASRLSLDWGHPDPYKGLLRGSLRFELARDTTVSLKPRGGHWSLALSSKW